MKSYYSNYELLHPWSAEFYMQATHNITDERIDLVYADQTNKAILDNIQDTMIIGYRGGRYTIAHGCKEPYMIGEYFDFSVDKGTCEVVRLNDGNVGIVNENGLQIEFIPMSNATGLLIRKCVDSEYHVYSDFESFVNCVMEYSKDFGLTDPALIADTITTYNF